MTKKELEEKVDSLKRSNSALKGQITKLEAKLADSARKPDGRELRARVRTLLSAIDRKGLSNQIGNHSEVDDVRALVA